MMMNQAWVIDAVRIPRATVKSAVYAKLQPVELLEPLYNALCTRHHLDSCFVEDVLLGCSTQTAGQGANIAKISSLFAGWSEQVSGVTLNRFCCSGLDAINLAASKIMSGMESLVVAGGVEQMTQVPMFADKGAWFSDPTVMARTRFIHMGLSADLIACQEGYSRGQLDELSLLSHQRAHNATSNRYFSPSLVPILAPENNPILEQDNAIRTNLNKDNLAALPCAFSDYLESAKPLVHNVYPGQDLFARHSVGNAPALADGASLVLLGNKTQCEALNLTPRARISHFTNASDEPVKMLTGHIKATEKLLKATGLNPKDIDLWEVNESFAASVLKFQDSFELDTDIVNVNGSAIAMGHPLGATGGNLLCTLLDELERRDKKRGVIAIPGGAGVGVATLIER